MRRLLTIGIAACLAVSCRSSTSEGKEKGDAQLSNGPAAPPAPPAPSAPSAPSAPAAQAAREDHGPLEPGLSARFYFIGEPMEKLCPLVENQTPNVSMVVPSLDLMSGKDDKVAAAGDEKIGDLDYVFMTVVAGFLVVTEPGQYTLRLESDDGSTLRLDENLVLDHDGLHATTARDADLDLAAGEHALEIRHFQSYGGWSLKLSWKRPGSQDFEIVPSQHLACHKGEVRVTSPGPKKILKPLQRGTPGDGLPLVDVHPSYDLMTVRPEGFEPRVGGIAWLSDGRMVLSTWDAEGCVYILSGVQGDDRSKITVEKFASGLAEPLGVAVVNDRIFVLQKQELTELVDQDGDGRADEYKCVCSGWEVSANFHEFAFGLVFKDGFFYCNLAVAINPGGKSTNPQVAGRGSTLKVPLNGGAYEVVAHGLRTPNGIGLGVDGEIFLTDNQGDWLPSSKLLHLKKGAFYGSRAVLLERAADFPVTPPVLWMPQNEIGNSPSNPTLIPPGNGPYSGQMCHGDVTHGGVKRDFIEKIEGEYQGCVFRWTQGLEAGVNRSSWGPDHALYVGGIGSTGNWGQEKKQRFGLQRLKYNGKPCFEMLAVRAMTNGMEIEFTEPIAADLGYEVENYAVEEWRYVPTTDYGGPKVDQRPVQVRCASIESGRTKVFLEMDGLAPGNVVYIRLVGPIVSQSGRKLWSTEAWYTLERIPKKKLFESFCAFRDYPPKRPQNVLSDAERAQGWRLLFDGETTQGWRGFKETEMPGSWKAIQGALFCAGGGGDIVTKEEFGDFELQLDWMIEKAGNSGIFFHVTEDHDHAWESGPEMQVLDNDGHPDGQNPLTSAGSNYALHAPQWDVTRPLGLWNQARILVKKGHVEHWLNGTKLFEYELWTPEWRVLVAASKFASMPGYGLAKNGHIALQDHGDRVAYRNIKIRLPLGE